MGDICRKPIQEKMMHATTKMLCATIIVLASTLPMTSHAQEKSTQEITQAAGYVHLNAKGKKIGHDRIQARCVMDKNTGLVWELKTTDGSVHDRENNYRGAVQVLRKPVADFLMIGIHSSNKATQKNSAVLMTGAYRLLSN